MLELQECRVGLIGLGYVGLPLACAFGQIFPTLGFDINTRRIEELKSGIDVTLETSSEEFDKAVHLTFSSDRASLADCNTYVVTVPTPIDEYNRPDLTPLFSASETVGAVISKGDIVIFESTVYPGATEQDCIPIIERVSGLKFNEDFFAGYSPERINPGDKVHRLQTIKKITAGSTPRAAEFVDLLYNRIIPAGTHLATSIRVAEAAKVIENTQRDLNIALVNELALIFERLGIDTIDVLEAAGTKWNFMPFRPGLVGGHCIGVDPYYLTHKAEHVGYIPQVILAGRRTNDSMGGHIALQVAKLMSGKGIALKGARVLVLGLTFKENCPDIRNSKTPDIVSELEDFGIDVSVSDPWADPGGAKAELDIDLLEHPQANGFDAVVVAVKHDRFASDEQWDAGRFVRDNGVVYDVKALYPKERGFRRL